MFRKSLIVVAAVAAMALPAAALGDGGTPAPDPGAKIAAAQAKLEALKAKCDASPKASAKCAKVAARVLDRLNKISAHIDTVEGKINSKCSVATPPAKCSQAADHARRSSTRRSRPSPSSRPGSRRTSRLAAPAAA